ncbi:MAG: hypothetical protein HY821_16220 [Acidobacteria bacterium]|nr:hypothetical protein [Acidobacteriota bacterium]
MSENSRNFQVSDASGRTWQVEFRWQQNGISIRHSDSVDCKYYLSSGAEKRELAVALMHPDLSRAAEKLGRAVSDAWCLRLAAAHVRRLIESGQDLENALVVVAPEALAGYAEALDRADRAEQERLAATR